MTQRYLIEVDPQRIKWNPRNPRKHRGTEYIRLRESIKAIGIVQPPTVRVLPGGFFEVIDGEGRVSVAQELRFEQIWVVSVGSIDEPEALVMLQASNVVRSFHFLAECKGLANLHRQGMPNRELAQQFGGSEARIQAMVAIGYFPVETLRLIEEHIASSEKQAEVWGYGLLETTLSLREILPGQSPSGGHQHSLDGIYNYSEVHKAVKKVLGGEITHGTEMRIYVANRKNEIYQARFNQDLQRKLAEEIARIQQDINIAKAKQVLEIEQKTQQRYADQVAMLQQQLVDLNERYTKIVNDASKRPGVLEERENELREALQKTAEERQHFQDLQQSLEEQAFQAQAKIEEEVQRAKQLLEEEAKQILDEEIAAQRKEQKRILKQSEDDLKAYYEQKDRERQIKAENTIRGLLSHGVKSLAETQQVVEHIVSRSMIEAVRQLGGTQQNSLLAAMRAMREALERAEDKLTYGESVLYVEGGIVNGHTARHPDSPKGPTQ